MTKETLEKGQEILAEIEEIETHLSDVEFAIANKDALEVKFYTGNQISLSYESLFPITLNNFIHQYRDALKSKSARLKRQFARL